MPRKVLIMFLLIALGVSKSSAQMAVATSVTWNIDCTVEIPVERDSVWTILKDYSLIMQISNGFVRTIVNKDEVMPILRETTFKDGTKREEILSQMEEQHRFIVFKIKDNSLPAGIESAQIAVFTKELSDDLTEVNWKGIVKGEKDAEAKYIEMLKLEIDQYKIGLKKYLSSEVRTVPMMRMR